MFLLGMLVGFVVGVTVLVMVTIVVVDRAMKKDETHPN